MLKEVYEIVDHYSSSGKSLLEPNIVLEGDSPKDALNGYLKMQGLNHLNVKRSGSDHVQFGVLPAVIEGAKILRDARSHRKASWYQIV